MTEENELKVKEVKREDGKVLMVVIDYWPFLMEFIQKNGRTSLRCFQRFDDCRDEPDWIPPNYFGPAINIARGIFSSSRKKTKGLRLQARLLP